MKKTISKIRESIGLGRIHCGCCGYESSMIDFDSDEAITFLLKEISDLKKELIRLHKYLREDENKVYKKIKIFEKALKFCSDYKNKDVLKLKQVSKKALKYREWI